MADKAGKPYVKLATTLVVIGMGIFSLERLGLYRLEGPNHSIPLNGTIVSLLVLVPLGLVVAGAVVFIVGRMRRR